MAIFTDDKGKKVKTTHFGAAGFSHYPIHKDDERKKRYIDRHKKSENWNNTSITLQVPCHAGFSGINQLFAIQLLTIKGGLS